jgi:putative hydrolase of the HAD superfamily
MVQEKKVKALGLEPYFKKIFITHRYGIHNAKPSVYCFEKIAALEKEKRSNIVYIADNVTKDFVNLRKHGYRTVRVLTGNYAHLNPARGFEADVSIDSLASLDYPFLKKHFNLA